jgi:eukaryotic-like serine/threonine-protein kinase
MSASISESPTLVHSLDPRGEVLRPGAANRPRSRPLAARYELRARLGRGSSATVYAAIDIRLNRPVTVKLFDAAVAADSALRHRFEQQVAKAAQLRHSHIAGILDAGFAAEGDQGEQPYVVTAAWGASTLREHLARERFLAPQQAVMIARQLASALSHAHYRGIVHADVRPENVLVDETGRRAKLVDFSLSFVSSATGVVTRETFARRAAYLAPEQVRGEPVGPATDVYGLGMLLYELVAGRPPFVGASARIAAERRLDEDPRPPSVFEPSVPADIEAVVGRALERSPAMRWSSIEQFDDALSRLDSAQLRPREVPAAMGAVEPPVGRPRPAGGPERRHPLAFALPALAAAWALAMALTFFDPLVGSVQGFGGAFNGLFGTPRVPDVVGMPVEDARKLARSRGFEVSVVGNRVSDRLPSGAIIQQSPIGGWQPDSEQPVRVTVSAGVAVPDVRGTPLADATAALEASGWTVARVERAAQPDTPSGTVYLQHPAPGVAPAPGEMVLAVAE